MSSFAAATRPTRRDAIKHPFRSLAAIILVAIPVALICIGLVNDHSRQAALFQETSRTTAFYSGGVCEQSVNGYESHCTPGEKDNEYATLQANIPDGFTADLKVSGNDYLTYGDVTAQIYINQFNSDIAPSAGEIAVPNRVLEQLGATIGDVVTFQDGREVTISGVTPSGTSVVAEPTLVDPADFVEGELTGTWRIIGTEAFTWDDVLALNQVGFVVTSQDVIDNPPPADQVTYQTPESTQFHNVGILDILFSIIWAIPMIIVAFLALMLISPVFTISVSRQTRNFALLASQGATPRHIRWAVLMYGLFAGIVGSIVGAVVGVLGASVWWRSNYSEWPIVVPWQWILLTIGLAIIGSTAAAFLPAFIAGRSSIISGIHGGGNDRLMRWRKWMAIGPITLIVLAIVFFLIRFIPEPQRSIYGPVNYPWKELLAFPGALLAVIAVAASAPAIVWLLGSLKGPLALRLAARDLRRQSMRSIPAIAAIASVLFIATATTISSNASSESSTTAAHSVYPSGTIMLGVEEGVEEDLDSAVETIEAQVGRTQRINLYGANGYDKWIDYPSHITENIDWVPSIASNIGASTLIASPELMKFFGAETEVNGSALVLSSADTAEAREVKLSGEGMTNTSAVLDARPVLPTLYADALLTEDAFNEFGLEKEFVGAILVAEDISEADRTALRTEFEDIPGIMVTYPVNPWSSPEADFQVAAALTGMVIAVMALVLALSSQQIRRQKEILEAIGAGPNLSRNANALFGALCALGGAMGVLAGYLAAMSLASTAHEVNGVVYRYGSIAEIEPNWWLILGLFAVAPVVTAALGWIFVKASPSELRREA